MLQVPVFAEHTDEHQWPYFDEQKKLWDKVEANTNTPILEREYSHIRDLADDDADLMIKIYNDPNLEMFFGDNALCNRQNISVCNSENISEYLSIASDPYHYVLYLNLPLTIVMVAVVVIIVCFWRKSKKS